MKQVKIYQKQVSYVSLKCCFIDYCFLIIVSYSIVL